jgi:hypothetical protein
MPVKFQTVKSRPAGNRQKRLSGGQKKESSPREDFLERRNRKDNLRAYFYFFIVTEIFSKKSKNPDGFLTKKIGDHSIDRPIPERKSKERIQRNSLLLFYFRMPRGGFLRCRSFQELIFIANTDLPPGTNFREKSIMSVNIRLTHATL